MGGNGFSFTLRLATADAKGQNRFFKVDRVVVKVENLDVRLKQSRHKLLFGFFRPLLLGIIKPVVQKVAEIQIRQQFDKLDEQCYGVYKEYQRLKKLALENPDEAQNTLSLYWQAIQRQIAELREKSDDAAGKVNIATTLHDSKFKNIKLAGATTEATKYKNMANEGQDWHCPIFDLGSAGTTKPAPSSKEVKRKSPEEKIHLKHSRDLNGSASSNQTNKYGAKSTSSPNTYSRNDYSINSGLGSKDNFTSSFSDDLADLTSGNIGSSIPSAGRNRVVDANI